MNCKVKRTLTFLIILVVGFVAAQYAPQDWGGYGAMVVILALAVVGAFCWLVSALGARRNPYAGAQRLPPKKREEARAKVKRITDGWTPDSVFDRDDDTYAQQHAADHAANVERIGYGQKHPKPDREIQTPELPEGKPITKTSPAKLPEWGVVMHEDQPINVTQEFGKIKRH